MRSKPCLAALASIVLALAGAGAYAQTYPSKPVRMVIPVPPGGGADAMGRIIGMKLADMWGQQVIFDNRAGAGGNIGAEVAARAAPDGYTIAVMNVGIVAINPVLYRRVPYDPVRDFAPLAMGGRFPHILVAHPSVPVRTATDVVRLARTKPGEVAYSSAGVGTPNHLAGELFGSMARVKLLHVPYKGTGPQVVALVGGEVSLSFSPLPAALPHVSSGRLRSVAVTTLKRLPQLPDVPTVDESGLPGYEVIAWNGFVFPGGTPSEIIRKVNEDIGRILAMPDVRERLVADGWDPWAISPDVFGKFIRAEMEKWGRVVRESGARAD